MGIDTPNPTFSWQTESDERGFLQSAYELVVKSASGTEVWKSGKVESALQNQIAYAGSPLHLVPLIPGQLQSMIRKVKRQ